MDLETRIRRRARHSGDDRLLVDYEALSPVAHVEEPPGRGPVVERILDHLDPVFEGDNPGDAAVWGPPGSGKSAIATSLVDRLDAHSLGSESIIHTSTRAQPPDPRAFVYLDARTARSDFQLYRRALDGLVTESVPENGVSTTELRSRLDRQLADYATAVFVVDHLDEPRTMSSETAREHVASLDGETSILAVSRSPPEGAWADSVVEMPAYSQQVLVDILTTRASEGLARKALGHERARRIAEWAGGDAHDALAALFGAADAAETAGRARITDADLETGMDAVPRPSNSLGRVLTLPENRQLVLRELVELPEDRLNSVSTATEAVAGRAGVDLSTGTVRRFLYELAETGIVERIQRDRTDGQGRPPSRIEPRFPTLVFRRLYDL